MPRKPMPWFRFYVDAVHDRKLRRMSPGIRWTWVATLALVRRSPTPPFLLIGEDQPADEHDLADIAAVPLKTARAALKAFDEAGMIQWDEPRKCWWVTKWTDRQYESDDVTKRTRKARAKAAPDPVEPAESGDVGTTLERSQPVPWNVVTPLLERSRSVTDAETDTDTESSSYEIAEGLTGRRSAG